MSLRWQLVAVQHWLSVIKRMSSFTDCILFALNVVDELKGVSSLSSSLHLNLFYWLFVELRVPALCLFMQYKCASRSFCLLIIFLIIIYSQRSNTNILILVLLLSIVQCSMRLYWRGIWRMEHCSSFSGLLHRTAVTMSITFEPTGRWQINLLREYCL